jgi:Cu(I)/Ag(I) efflux system membrane fusion protein
VTAPIGGLLAELMVRQGMTVGMGMPLARINGLSTVWVEAAVPEPLAAGVAPGQGAEVRLNALPGQVIRGRVAAVLPEANRDTRTLRVRVELPNPGLKLRAGMFAQVALQGASQGEALTVPAEAVVRTGRRALVYLLEAGGRYRPLEVELGPEVGERIVVRKGLERGQQVVASGQFLIDSEASLQGLTTRAATPSRSTTRRCPRSSGRRCRCLSGSSGPTSPRACSRATRCAFGSASRATSPS